jgi:hypothetical protein
MKRIQERRIEVEENLGLKKKERTEMYGHECVCVCLNYKEYNSGRFVAVHFSKGCQVFFVHKEGILSVNVERKGLVLFGKIIPHSRGVNRGTRNLRFRTFSSYSPNASLYQLCGHLDDETDVINSENILL